MKQPLNYKSKYDSFYQCFANHSGIMKAMDDFQCGTMSRRKCADIIIKFMRKDYELKQSTIEELTALGGYTEEEK